MPLGPENREVKQAEENVEPPVQVPFFGGGMKSPPAGDLRAVHPLDSGLRDVQHDLVIEDRCAVQHPTQPESGVLDRPYQTFRRLWSRRCLR